MSKNVVVAGAILAALAVTVGAYAAGGQMMMGPSRTIAQPSFKGYYDGHKDT